MKNIQHTQLLQALNGPMMIASGCDAVIEQMIAAAASIDRTEARYDDDVMRDILFDNATPYNAYGDFYYRYPVLLGSTLIIPVTGVLVREDNWRNPGVNTIAGWYAVAAADSRVERIIEYMDSPGGSVFGIQELADCKLACEKPIETLVFGFCTSAAAWVALASNSIRATSKNCMFGSIGAKLSFRSNKAYYEKEGMIRKDVYAATSPKKDYEFREAEDKGNFVPMENGFLKDIDANFMDFVTSRRDVSAEILKGDIVLADKAIAENLCDGYTTLNQLLLNQSINLNTTEMSNGISELLRNMAAKIDGTATDAELQASADAAIAENEQLKSEVANANREKAAIADAKVAAEQALADKQAAWDAEKAALQAQIRNQDKPDAKPTIPVAKAADLTTEEKGKTPEERIAQDPLTVAALEALAVM